MTVTAPRPSELGREANGMLGMLVTTTFEAVSEPPRHRSPVFPSSRAWGCSAGSQCN